MDKEVVCKSFFIRETESLSEKGLQESESRNEGQTDIREYNKGTHDEFRALGTYHRMLCRFCYASGSKK
jgi:hypothetical protein